MSKPKRTSVQRLLKDEARTRLSSINHDLTRRQYIRDFDRYIQFCRVKYDVKSFDDLREHVQQYVDELVKQGMSSSTIHTYVASIAKTLRMKMSEVNKPIRHTADFRKGRKDYEDLSKYHGDRDLNSFEHRYIVDFATHTGLRRSEYQKLTGDCLVRDESNKLCILVKKSKGGKKNHMQRIESGYEDLISEYFKDKAPDEKIFKSKDLDNKLNLHTLRAKLAQREYDRLFELCLKDPSYCTVLEAEIRERWKKNKYKNGMVKPFPEHEIKGVYVLRGNNRTYALEHNKPIAYSRLILMYISIFNLSHWRVDVSLQNYILPSII